MTPNPKDDDVQGPSIVRPHHAQDREISTVAGAPKAWRRLDGLAWMAERGDIQGHHVEAGRRLQEDYEISQMQAGSRSGAGKVDGSRGYDIPDHAIDAKGRVDAAMAILPPEVMTMIALFLLPCSLGTHFSMEMIAARVGEHKRAVSLGIRTGLSLLARHYGCCT